MYLVLRKSIASLSVTMCIIFGDVGDTHLIINIHLYKSKDVYQIDPLISLCCSLSLSLLRVFSRPILWSISIGSWPSETTVAAVVVVPSTIHCCVVSDMSWVPVFVCVCVCVCVCVATLMCHFKPQIQADHAMTSLTLKCSGSQKQRASFPHSYTPVSTHTLNIPPDLIIAPACVPPPSFLLSHFTTTFHPPASRPPPSLLLLKLSVSVRLCSRSRSNFPPTVQLILSMTSSFSIHLFLSFMNLHSTFVSACHLLL